MLTTAQADQDRTYLSRTAGLSSISLFVFLAYAISWYIWIWTGHFNSVFYIRIGTVTISAQVKLLILALGNLGPAISATVVLGLTEGRAGIRRLWGALTHCGLKLPWTLAVSLLIPFLYSVALALYAICGGKIAPTGTPIRWLLLIAVNLPFAGVGEEIGWRGFLLPRLETSYKALTASAILAAIWGPWHIPLHSTEPITYWLWFLVMVFAVAIIFTWVYNLSGGALFPVVLLHTILDETGLYLLGPTIQLYGIGLFRFAVALLACAAILIVSLAGPDLSRNSPARLASTDTDANLRPPAV